MKAPLKQLIANGRTEEALKQLLAISPQLSDPNLQHAIAIQSANFKKYQDGQITATTSFEQEGLSIAQINLAVLRIIDQLPDGQENADATSSSNPEPSTPAPTKRGWLWVVGIILAAIPILAGIAEISGYSVKDFISGNENNLESLMVTVIVHGKDGRDDRILEGQGKVVLDIGGTREEEAINQQGQAIFNGLSTNFEGKMALISIDHPQPYFPTKRDAEYQLEKNKSIYLEVELTGLNEIKGRVLDFNTELPLDSVEVVVEDAVAYTDQRGFYRMEIPPNIQAKFIKVSFLKEGYKMESVDSIAPHTKQEIGIMLRPIEE